MLVGYDYVRGGGGVIFLRWWWYGMDRGILIKFGVVRYYFSLEELFFNFLFFVCWS